MFQTCNKLVFDGVSRPSGSISVWTTALNHEAGNNAVENQAIIEPISAKFHEILNCDGRLVGEQLYLNRAHARIKNGRWICQVKSRSPSLWVRLCIRRISSQGAAAVLELANEKSVRPLVSSVYHRQCL
jgi:hypothetical protein